MVFIRAAPPAVNSFQELPAELRIAIWTLLIEPRVVPIVESNGQVYSTCPVPVILHICHESRQIGLKFYETSIGLVYANLTDCFGRDYKEPLIYFNSKLDILYACRSFKFIWHLYPALCQYKGVAFAIECHTFYDYFRATARTHRLRHDIGGMSLEFFLGLQSIFLVFEEPGPVHKGDIELVDVLDDELAKLRDAQNSDCMAVLCRGKSSPKVSHKWMISRSGTLR